MKQIAITPRYLDTEEGDFLVIKKKYYPFFEKYGFTLTLIPFTTNKKIIEKIALKSDLVLFAGGYRNYTEEIRKFEISVLRIALKNRIPIMGICCGMWTINVFFGGSIKDVEGHEGRVSNPFHKAKIVGLLEEKDIQINSFHQKAIDRLGEGVKPLIIASDGTIEAIYRNNNILGIQFHLENEGCTEGLANDIINLVKRMIRYEQEEIINESITRALSSKDFKRLTKSELENQSLKRKIKEMEEHIEDLKHGTC